MIYANKEHQVAYEVIQKFTHKVICIRVDYNTHERLNNQQHILKRHGSAIKNNYMKFWRKQ